MNTPPSQKWASRCFSTGGAQRSDVSQWIRRSSPKPKFFSPGANTWLIATAGTPSWVASRAAAMVPE